MRARACAVWQTLHIRLCDSMHSPEQHALRTCKVLQVYALARELDSSSDSAGSTWHKQKPSRQPQRRGAHLIWHSFSSGRPLQVFRQMRSSRQLISPMQPASCVWQLFSRQVPTLAGSDAAELGNGATASAKAAQHELA